MAIRYDLAEPHLNKAGISLTADFHTLTSSQVEVLVDLAKALNYRKPKNANGSTARYCFDALRRQHNRERK